MTDPPLDSGPTGGESADASEVALERLLGIRSRIGDLEVRKLQAVVEWMVVNEVDPLTHDTGPLCNRAIRRLMRGHRS